MIYLIHFDKPLHHARHYLGFCENDLERRIKEHKKGNGSPLMRAVKKAGINWSVVRVWEGDRLLERKMKRRKKIKRYCPMCKFGVSDYDFSSH
jgi:predicted GIY-YIG superfamily endonuclease